MKLYTLVEKIRYAMAHAQSREEVDLYRDDFVNDLNEAIESAREGWGDDKEAAKAHGQRTDRFLEALFDRRFAELPAAVDGSQTDVN